MSPEDARSENRSAETARSAAADWLERRTGDGWNDVDQAVFDAWLAASASNRIAYLRVETAWARTYRLAALRPTSQNDARKEWLPWIAKIAAGLSVAAVIGFATGLIPTGSNTQTFTTGLGGHSRLQLADGSTIELNTNTVLRIDMDASHRAATLERGEAYFSIRHDAARPFVVTAGNHKVVDLGTKFLMRTTGNKLEVALVEGSAKVEGSGAASRSVTLKPGDIAYALPGSVSVVRKTPADIAPDLGWRRGVLVFRHATLQEAAEEFNRYNAQKVVIADPETARLTFSATLPTHDTKAFVRILGKLFNTHDQSTTEGIVISR